MQSLTRLREIDLKLNALIGLEGNLDVGLSSSYLLYVQLSPSEIVRSVTFNCQK